MKDNWEFNLDYSKVCSSNTSCAGTITRSKVDKEWTFEKGTMSGKSNEEQIYEGWSSNHEKWGSSGGIFPEYASLKSMFKNIKGYFKEKSQNK